MYNFANIDTVGTVILRKKNSEQFLICFKWRNILYSVCIFHSFKSFLKIENKTLIFLKAYSIRKFPKTIDFFIKIR